MFIQSSSSSNFLPPCCCCWYKYKLHVTNSNNCTRVQCRIGQDRTGRVILNLLSSSLSTAAAISRWNVSQLGGSLFSSAASDVCIYNYTRMNERTNERARKRKGEEGGGGGGGKVPSPSDEGTDGRRRRRRRCCCCSKSTVNPSRMNDQQQRHSTRLDSMGIAAHIASHRSPRLIPFDSSTTN